MRDIGAVMVWHRTYGALNPKSDPQEEGPGGMTACWVSPGDTPVLVSFNGCRIVSWSSSE